MVGEPEITAKQRQHRASTPTPSAALPERINKQPLAEAPATQAGTNAGRIAGALETRAQATTRAETNASATEARTLEAETPLSWEEFRQQARQQAEKNPGLQGDEKKIERAIDHAEFIASARGEAKALQMLANVDLITLMNNARVAHADTGEGGTLTDAIERMHRQREPKMSEGEFEERAREAAEKNSDLKGDEERTGRAIGYAKLIAGWKGKARALQMLETVALNSLGKAATNAHKRRGGVGSASETVAKQLDEKSGFKAKVIEAAAQNPHLEAYRDTPGALARRAVSIASSVGEKQTLEVMRTAEYSEIVGMLKRAREAQSKAVVEARNSAELEANALETESARPRRSDEFEAAARYAASRNKHLQGNEIKIGRALECAREIAEHNGEEEALRTLQSDRLEELETAVRRVREISEDVGKLRKEERERPLQRETKKTPAKLSGEFERKAREAAKENPDLKKKGRVEKALKHARVIAEHAGEAEALENLRGRHLAAMAATASALKREARKHPKQAVQQQRSPDFEARAREAAARNPHLQTDTRKYTSEEMKMIERALLYAEAIADARGEAKALELLERSTFNKIGTAGAFAHKKLGRQGGLREEIEAKIREREPKMSEKEFKAKARELAEKNPDLNSEEKRIAQALECARIIAGHKGKAFALKMLEKGTLRGIAVSASRGRNPLKKADKLAQESGKDAKLKRILALKSMFEEKDYAEAITLVKKLAEWLGSEEEAVEILRASDTLEEFEAKALKELGGNEDGREREFDGGLERTWLARVRTVVDRILDEKFEASEEMFAAKRAFVNAVTACNGSRQKLERVFKIVDEARGPHSLLLLLNELGGEERGDANHSRGGTTDEAREELGKKFSGEEIVFLREVLGFSSEEMNDLAQGEASARRQAAEALAKMRKQALEEPKDARGLEYIEIMKKILGAKEERVRVFELAEQMGVSHHKVRRKVDKAEFYLRDYALNEETGEVGKQVKTRKKAEEIMSGIIKRLRKQESEWKPKKYVQFAQSTSVLETTWRDKPERAREPRERMQNRAELEPEWMPPARAKQTLARSPVVVRRRVGDRTQLQPSEALRRERETPLPAETRTATRKPAREIVDAVIARLQKERRVETTASARRATLERTATLQQAEARATTAQPQATITGQMSEAEFEKQAREIIAGKGASGYLAVEMLELAWQVAGIAGREKALEVLERAVNARSLRIAFGKLKNEREKAGTLVTLQAKPLETTAKPAETTAKHETPKLRKPATIEQVASRSLHVEGAMGVRESAPEAKQVSEREDAAASKTGGKAVEAERARESEQAAAATRRVESTAREEERAREDVVASAREANGAVAASEDFSLGAMLQVLSLNGQGDEARLKKVLGRINASTGALELARQSKKQECKALELRFGLKGEGGVMNACDALSDNGKRVTPQELEALVEAGLNELRAALVFDAFTCDVRSPENLERRREAVQLARSRGALKKLKKKDELAFEVLAHRYLNGTEVPSFAQVASQLYAAKLSKRLLGADYVRIIEKKGIDAILGDVMAQS